jgi:hypothetical protein
MYYRLPRRSRTPFGRHTPVSLTILSILVFGLSNSQASTISGQRISKYTVSWESDVASGLSGMGLVRTRILAVTLVDH